MEEDVKQMEEELKIKINTLMWECLPADTTLVEVENINVNDRYIKLLNLNNDTFLIRY